MQIISILQKIFSDIKNLLVEYNISVYFKKLRIICDFEKSPIKSVKEVLLGAKIQGCYFHQVKASWKKARKLHLTRREFLRDTKLIIFAMKLYPLILSQNKLKYITNVYNYASNSNKDFKKLNRYFKKNWEKSPFLCFDTLPNGEIWNRTNNFIESFHQ